MGLIAPVSRVRIDLRNLGGLDSVLSGKISSFCRNAELGSPRYDFRGAGFDAPNREADWPLWKRPDGEDCRFGISSDADRNRPGSRLRLADRSGDRLWALEGHAWCFRQFAGHHRRKCNGAARPGSISVLLESARRERLRVAQRVNAPRLRPGTAPDGH